MFPCQPVDKVWVWNVWACRHVEEICRPSWSERVWLPHRPANKIIFGGQLSSFLQPALTHRAALSLHLRQLVIFMFSPVIFGSDWKKEVGLSPCLPQQSAPFHYVYYDMHKYTRQRWMIYFFMLFRLPPLDSFWWSTSNNKQVLFWLKKNPFHYLHTASKRPTPLNWLAAHC